MHVAVNTALSRFVFILPIRIKYLGISCNETGHCHECIGHLDFLIHDGIDPKHLPTFSMDFLSDMLDPLLIWIPLLCRPSNSLFSITCLFTYIIETFWCTGILKFILCVSLIFISLKNVCLCQDDKKCLIVSTSFINLPFHLNSLCRAGIER